MLHDFPCAVRLRALLCGLAGLSAPALAGAPIVGAAQAPAPALPTPAQAAPAIAAAPVASASYPAGTSAEARARWEKLCRALAPAADASAAGPASGFEFFLEGSAYSGEKGSHDFKARYRFLEPNNLSIQSLDTDRTRLRGPRGDFLLEKDGQTIKLEGRDFQEDLRELDEQSALARMFLRLAHPGRLRLEKLELLEAPPASLPGTPAMAELARGLEWIQIESPDLGPGAQAPSSALGAIGLEPGSGLPALALFLQAPRGAAQRVEFAQLLRLKRWEKVEGRTVPLEVRAFAPDPARAELVFAAKPNLDLWLDPKRSRFALDLKAQDFEPRR